jgi:hypothetical protein
MDQFHEVVRHPDELTVCGRGHIRYAMWWSTTVAVLHRPNRSTVEASQVRYIGESGSPLTSYVMMLTKEKVRLCRSSWDG